MSPRLARGENVADDEAGQSVAVVVAVSAATSVAAQLPETN